MIELLKVMDPTSVKASSEQNIGQQLFSLFSQSDVSESDLITFLRLSFPRGPNSTGWLTTDCHGDSLLHKAVENLRPQVIKFLLSQKPELAGMTNAQGFTPLQALEDRMDSIRHPILGTFHRGPPFTGFSHDYVASVAVLRGQDPVIELPPEAVDVGYLSSLTWPGNGVADVILKTLRIKYGCSCDQCVAGFLSPKMRYALSDFAREYIIDFKGPAWMETAGPFLAGSAQTRLRKGYPLMQDGYMLICSYIHRLCSEEKMIPSEENILKYARTRETELSVAGLAVFFAQGGSVAAVAKDIFEVASIYFESEDDEFSDPNLPFNALLARKLGKETGSDKEVSEEKGEKKELPKCANDKEISFVQMMCGY